MREILLDGRTWSSPNDVYDAFFQAVGAPSWHGRNFNALRDSIVTGRINQVDLPYIVKIKSYDQIGAGAKKMAADLVGLITELRESGCPIDIQVAS